MKRLKVSRYFIDNLLGTLCGSGLPISSSKSDRIKLPVGSL